MITQTYTFRDLPKKIRENTDGARNRFTSGVESDIAEETGRVTDMKWEMDVTGYELLLTIDVAEEDSRFLECALHNLHQAKLLS